MNIHRPLPANYDERDAEMFAPHREYALPETGPVSFKNVLGSGMSYLVQGIQLLPESFHDTLESPEWKWQWNEHRKPIIRLKTLLHVWKNRRGKLIQEPAIWFTDTWSLSYYFWFAETLPRLCSVEALWREGMPVYIPERFCEVEFVKECLDRFNIPNLRTIPPKAAYRFSELIIPKRTAGIHHAHPAYIKRATQILRGDASAKGSRKIHISRAKARLRKFINQQEVDAIFDRYGYETVCMEDLSWKSQATMMAESSVMASIHGAGIANMILQPPGSHILEMRMTGDFNSSYYNMAHACGHNYYYLNCQPELEGVHEQKNNFIAPLGKLEETLDLIEQSHD